MTKCKTCDGRGYIIVPDWLDDRFEKEPCEECWGRGESPTAKENSDE